MTSALRKSGRRHQGQDLSPAGDRDAGRDLAASEEAPPPQDVERVGRSDGHGARRRQLLEDDVERSGGSAGLEADLPRGVALERDPDAVLDLRVESHVERSDARHALAVESHRGPGRLGPHRNEVGRGLQRDRDRLAGGQRKAHAARLVSVAGLAEGEHHLLRHRGGHDQLAVRDDAGVAPVDEDRSAQGLRAHAQAHLGGRLRATPAQQHRDRHGRDPDQGGQGPEPGSRWRLPHGRRRRAGCGGRGDHDGRQEPGGGLAARGRGLERGLELRVARRLGRGRLAPVLLLAHEGPQRASRLGEPRVRGDEPTKPGDGLVPVARTGGLAGGGERLHRQGGGRGPGFLRLLEHGRQLVGERGRPRVAGARVLGEGPRQYRLQLRAELAERREVGRGRLLVDDLVENLRRPLAPEGALAGDELVEDDPRREDVAAAVERLAAHLLGAHVVHGAHHHARLGQVGAPELGDPEVHDLRGAVLEEPHVAGLDVPVHDAPLVGVGEPPAHLGDHVELLGERHLVPRAQQRVEVGPGKHLHRDVGQPPVLAQLEDGDDVGVLQARRRLRLDLEAAAAVGVEAALGMEGLDRDLALERLVEAAVDHAHAPAPDAAGDQVPADAGAGPGVRRLGQHALTPRTSAGPR